MATIEKRTSGGSIKYRVKVRLKGHPPADATFERLTDAKRWAAETETRMREGRWFALAQARRFTLVELIDRYLTDYLPTAGLRSAADRRRHLAWWKDRLGDHLLADVTPDRIIAARAELLRTPTNRLRPDGTTGTMTPSTANRYVDALADCLTIGVNEFKMLDDTPMRKLSALKEPRGRIRFLTTDERLALLAECRAHSETLYTIVVLALATGARKGEILGLRWPDVDPHRGLLTFHETKNGERRTVPLVGHGSDVLKKYAKVRNIGTDLVFPGRDDKPLHIHAIFTKACTRAGIDDFRFHDLRHTAASELAMNGATLAEIAEILGHKTLDMVKRYAHLTEGHTRGVLERMAKRVFE